MEPRCVVAQYDPRDNDAPSGHHRAGRSGVKDGVSGVLGIDAEKLRVIAPAENQVAVWCQSQCLYRRSVGSWLAKELGHPNQVGGNTQRGLSHHQPRPQPGQHCAPRVGQKRQSLLPPTSRSIPGLLCSSISQCGIPPLTAMMMTGVSQNPNARCEAIGVVTNKGINEPYRGAGRPEAAFIMTAQWMCWQKSWASTQLKYATIPPEKFPYSTHPTRCQI